MTRVIFVKPNQSFKSYTDFWELVRLSNFEMCSVDGLDLSQHVVYIVSPLTTEWCPKVDQWDGRPRSAHLVLWHLERPVACGGVGWFRRQGEDLLGNRYFDEIWVSDRQLAKETGFRFVVLGSDERLGSPGKWKRYDCIHLSYRNERREEILASLNGLKVAPNGWGRKRSKRLRQSKFGLNIHQDQHPFLEPLRFALFAAYGLPIVSEVLKDPYPFTEHSLIMDNYSGLSESIRRVLSKDYWTFRQMGLALRRLLCKYHQFGRTVSHAVQESVNHPVFITGV